MSPTDNPWVLSNIIQPFPQLNIKNNIHIDDRRALLYRLKIHLITVFKLFFGTHLYTDGTDQKMLFFSFLENLFDTVKNYCLFWEPCVSEIYIYFFIFFVSYQKYFLMDPCLQGSKNKDERCLALNLDLEPTTCYLDFT